MGSIRKKKYNGCELSSPLYRQVAAEMARKKAKIKVLEENKPKRGKNK
jgi:hypothetical protein|tara:strand:- start:340 stop:483 length:144 start_codon:yes stop_codon:yes gene_type:complete